MKSEGTKIEEVTLTQVKPIQDHKEPESKAKVEAKKSEVIKPEAKAEVKKTEAKVEVKKPEAKVEKPSSKLVPQKIEEAKPTPK